MSEPPNDERRRSHRYPVQAPVLFKWTKEGITRRERGMSREISSGGLYVLCDTPPPAGATVWIEVLLPALEPDARSLHLKAKGTVLRVEELMNGTRGFAATSELRLDRAKQVNRETNPLMKTGREISGRGPERASRRLGGRS
jgi:PilZ domain-containing protein